MGLEAGDGHIAHGAQPAAPVGPAEGLSAVLDHQQMVVGRHLQQGVHLGRAALVGDDDHCLGPGRDFSLHIRRVQVQVVADVGEYRRYAEGEQGAVVGVPGEAGDNHLVPRAQAQSRHGAQQRRRAAGDAQGEPDAQTPANLGLKGRGLAGLADAVEAEGTLRKDDVRDLLELLAAQQGRARHLRGEGGGPYRRAAVKR